MTALQNAYLAAASDAIDRDRRLSHAALGRDIPYILLLHVGASTADMLPRLLELYRGKGFKFVSLEEATKDGFYRTDVNPRLPDTPASLEGLAAEKGVTLSPSAVVLPDFNSMCR